MRSSDPAPLISEEQIGQRVSELADEIDTDYAGRDVLLVGVLKGAFMVMADLARAIHTPAHFDFMAVASYGASTQTSGVVRILKDLDRDITGRNVIVIEDIVDTGLTLSYLLRLLGARGPASMEVLAMLAKPARLRVELPLRYIGFTVPNTFVVGYGLDYAEDYRNLSYIADLSGVAEGDDVGAAKTAVTESTDHAKAEDVAAGGTPPRAADT